MLFQACKELFMIQNKEKVLGVILAGGLSRRMKYQNKFLKKIKGRTMISIIISKALKQVDNLIINTNIDEKEIEKFKLPIIKDTLTGYQGPLAGILTAMEYAVKNKFKWVFTFPCDAPFFPDNLVEKILNIAKEKKSNIVIASSRGRVHPVFGIWSIGLKGSLKNSLIKYEIKKMDIWIKKNNFSVVNFSNNQIDPFFNINDSHDLEKANKIYKNVKKNK